MARGMRPATATDERRPPEPGAGTTLAGGEEAACGGCRGPRPLVRDYILRPGDEEAAGRTGHGRAAFRPNVAFNYLESGSFDYLLLGRYVHLPDRMLPSRSEEGLGAGYVPPSQDVGCV